MDREVKANTMYRHFKGFIAYVITIATNTETGEKMVIYVCNSSNVKSNSSHKDGIYARPLDMFLSEVDHEKYPDVKQKYRFELIEED
ncbi:MAG: DUF1653 domain-containing protein [Bacilli bacterium]|nr:DUF1653 domain-containing protein [Bacilli bacterium]